MECLVGGLSQSAGRIGGVAAGPEHCPTVQLPFLGGPPSACGCAGSHRKERAGGKDQVPPRVADLIEGARSLNHKISLLAAPADIRPPLNGCLPSGDQAPVMVRRVFPLHDQYTPRDDD